MESQLEKTNKEIDKNSGAFARAINKIDDFKAKAKEAGIDIDKLADNFIKVGTVLTGIGVISAKMAMDFDKEMAKVISATGKTGDEADELRRIILNTSRQYGISAADMAAGAQRVAWDWENAAVKLDNAARLSLVGITDVTTAVKLLESVATAYGSTIEEQTLLVDKLMVAYQRGEFSMGELGNSFGRVASIAAESGVQIDELLAIISASTNVGASASEAVTGLRQVISSIIKPSAQAAEEADRLGIKFNAQALQSKGLAQVLEEVRRATRGNTESMSLLFGNVNALAQIMAITGSDNEYYKDTLLAIAHAGGEANKTIEAMQTPAKDLSDAYNRLKINLIEGGAAFDGVIKVIAKFINMIAGVSPVTVGVITTFGSLVLVLGLIAKGYTTLKTVKAAYMAMKTVITALTVKETAANAGLAASQGARNKRRYLIGD
jgi:TP901 family phage tail tape measure protein